MEVCPFERLIGSCAGSVGRDDGRMHTGRDHEGMHTSARSPSSSPKGEHRQPPARSLAVSPTAAAVFALQRLAGNAAVAGVLVRTAVQRVKPPCPPAGVTAPLPTATVTATAAPSPAPAPAGGLPGGWGTGPGTSTSMEGSVERILLDNLSHGNQVPDPAPLAGGPGWATASGVPAVGSGPGGMGRAVALVPSALTAQPSGEVPVLLHLHGLGKGLRPRSGTPADVSAYQMPQQVESFLSSRGGSRLVAIMPIGISVPSRTPTGAVGTVAFGGFNSDALIGKVFGRLTSSGVVPAGSTPGGVILSAHSGGGLDVSSMLRGMSGSAPRLPRRLMAMFAFESVHGDLGDYKRFLRGKLDADLAELQRRATPTSAGTAGAPNLDQVFTSQARYLQDEGFRFMGFGGSGGYRARFAELEESICQWFSDNDSALRTAAGSRYTDILNLLWANYQSVTVSGSHHSDVLQGTLSQALRSLPPSVGRLASSVAPAPAPTRAPALPAAPRLGAAGMTDAKVPDADLRDAAAPIAVSRQTSSLSAFLAQTTPLARVVGPSARLPVSRQPSPSGSVAPAAPTRGDLEKQLIEEAARLGRLDGAAPASLAPGRTLLRSDDIRTSLLARASNPDLQRGFDLAMQVIVAMPESAEIHAQGEGLVRMLEDQFIRDPSRSALDLLPPDRASLYRGTRWGVNDYPGHGSEPAGPLEGRATTMAQELAGIRPERRPNVGPSAVLTREQATAARWAFIEANLVDVPGQPGRRLYREAASAFSRMQEIAQYDGVDLRILDAWRSRARAAANAASSGNPNAVASFSSHSLGLAIDLQMSAGSQTYRETTTHPMQNVADMRSSPVHKWMVLRGESFGWYPFGNEPWHWEYNPPGLRERFWQSFQP